MIFSMDIKLMGPADLGSLVKDNPDITKTFDVFVPRDFSPLLHPPILCWQGKVVWGFSYITAMNEQADQAAQSGGESSLSTLQLPVVDLGQSDAFYVVEKVLAAENRCDGYSFAEMDSIKAMMQALSLTEQQMRRLDPLVIKKGGFRSQIEQYRQLPAILQAAIASASFDLRTAVSLADLPAAVLSRLIDFNCSFSTRRILALRIMEIARRDQLDDKALQSLLDEVLQQDDPASAIYERRFPELASRLQRAEELNQQDFAGRRVNINLPDNLEGDSVKVVMQARNKAELNRNIQALQAAGEHLDEYLGLL